MEANDKVEETAFVDLYQGGLQISAARREGIDDRDVVALDCDETIFACNTKKCRATAIVRDVGNPRRRICAST